MNKLFILGSKRFLDLDLVNKEKWYLYQDENRLRVSRKDTGVSWVFSKSQFVDKLQYSVNYPGNEEVVFGLEEEGLEKLVGFLESLLEPYMQEFKLNITPPITKKPIKKHFYLLNKDKPTGMVKGTIFPNYIIRFTEVSGDPLTDSDIVVYVETSSQADFFFSFTNKYLGTFEHFAAMNKGEFEEIEPSYCAKLNDVLRAINYGNELEVKPV